MMENAVYSILSPESFAAIAVALIVGDELLTAAIEPGNALGERRRLLMKGRKAVAGVSSLSGIYGRKVFYIGSNHDLRPLTIAHRNKPFFGQVLAVFRNQFIKYILYRLQ